MNIDKKKCLYTFLNIGRTETSHPFSFGFIIFFNPTYDSHWKLPVRHDDKLSDSFVLLKFDQVAAHVMHHDFPFQSVI